MSYLLVPISTAATASTATADTAAAVVRPKIRKPVKGSKSLRRGGQ
jgi:hypothetical protein